MCVRPYFPPERKDHGSLDAKPSAAVYNAMNIEASEACKELEASSCDLKEGVISARYDVPSSSGSLLTSYESASGEIVDEYDTLATDAMLYKPKSTPPFISTVSPEADS